MIRKLCICAALCSLLSLSARAQKFYVTPTEKKFEQKIIDKMKYEGYRLVESKDSSDYIVDCLVDGHYNGWKIGSMFHGYVKISDSRTGTEVSRTKEVGKSPAAVNGFQAGPRIMAVIADRYLLKELQKVTAKHNQKQ